MRRCLSGGSWQAIVDGNYQATGRLQAPSPSVLKLPCWWIASRSEELLICLASQIRRQYNFGKESVSCTERVDTLGLEQWNVIVHGARSDTQRLIRASAVTCVPVNDRRKKIWMFLGGTRCPSGTNKVKLKKKTRAMMWYCRWSISSGDGKCWRCFTLILRLVA